MKLYATVTSERASKGQGGNEYIEVMLTAGNTKEPCWMGTISMREIASHKFQVFYTAPLAGKGDKSGVLYEANTKGTAFESKGEKQKGEKCRVETCQAEPVRGRRSCSYHTAQQ